MLGEYIMDGFRVAVVVAAMLIGFVALIALINGVLMRSSALHSRRCSDMYSRRLRFNRYSVE